MLLNYGVDCSLVRGQSVNVLLAELLMGFWKRALDDVCGDATCSILFCVTSGDETGALAKGTPDEMPYTSVEL